MHGEDVRLQRHDRAQRAGDGIGNVVELKVEKNREPGGRDPPDQTMFEAKKLGKNRMFAVS